MIATCLPTRCGVKHYAANSMEHTTEGLETHTRHNFDANITSQDLVDSYLAPFQVLATG